MIARIHPLLIWLAAAGSLASVGVAAIPVVSRYAARDAVWQAATGPRRDAPLETIRPDLAPILDFAPFGRAEPEATDIAPDPAAMADLNLTLQGVAITTPAEASQAIIAGGSAGTGSYRAGDAVAPGVTLTAVAADHVLLSVNGQPQRLGFPDAALTDSAPTDAAVEEFDDGGAPPATGPTATRPTATGPTATGTGVDLRNLIPVAAPADEAPPDEARATTLADTLAPIRADLLRNPRAVLARFGLAAEENGYRITDATPPDLLSIGLRPGDLVTALNGQALAGPVQDRPVFEAAAAAGQARLQVQRGDQSLSLTVPLQ